MIFQTKAKIIKNIEVTKDYYKIILFCPRIAKIVEPGQFLQVKANEGDEPLLRRPFSIHRIRNQKPETRNQIEILYEVVGKGTEILSQRKPGEYLDVIGPLGRGFDYSAPVPQCPSAPVLVAGGIGVAPLLFLAEKMVTKSPSHQVTRKPLVLLGAKTKSQILCEKEFQNLGCEVKIATDDGSRGFKGYVSDLLNKTLQLAISHKPLAIYACGPRPMLKEIAKISQQYSIPAQVSLEEHMACGIGACLGCVVKTQYACPPPAGERNTQYGFQYKRVCKEGPVFNADEIIWSNEDETYGTK